MLNENIKALRKSKGLSQEELALKLNVVRQTVSKWEQGLSVPDADMLIAIGEVFGTPVSTLLGENIPGERVDELRVISEKLEVVTMQLARRKVLRQRVLHWGFILVCLAILAGFAVMILLDGLNLDLDYSKPEYAAVGVAIHGFEWVFVRVAPLGFIGAVVGACLTRKIA